MAERGMGHWQFVEGTGDTFLMKPEAGADFTLLIKSQDMPTFRVDSDVVAAVGSQALRTDRAILEVDLSSKSLHRTEERCVQPVVLLHGSETAGDSSAYGRKNDKLHRFTG